MIIPNLLEKVGNTPMVSFKLDNYQNIHLEAKIEGYNPTGSVKDRAASYIIRKLLKTQVIDRDTTIIESTSGNFGVALSAFCQYFGLKFIAVVDPYITPMNEMLIASKGARVLKVNEPDQFGGYLLNRINKIKELQAEIQNVYWVNQYENPLNAQAYYHSLGKEICYQVEKIDYIFLGISSGGTISGVSRKVKENFPQAKIIAVDVEGSLIFKTKAKKRYIPGIGSSMRPKIIEKAHIDDVVIVNEASTIQACHELLNKYNCFVGGSSGSVFAGIKQYFSDKDLSEEINVVSMFADRGERYFDTIYNEQWTQRFLKKVKTPEYNVLG